MSIHSNRLKFYALDKRDFGIYKCALRNDFGYDQTIISIYGQNKKIICHEINDKRKNLCSNLEYDSVKEPLYVSIEVLEKSLLVQGQKASFTCKTSKSKFSYFNNLKTFFKDKKATLEWYRIEKYPILISNQSNLIISPIFAHDLGRYRCKVKNSAAPVYRDVLLNRTIYGRETVFYAYVEYQHPKIANYKRFEKNYQTFSLSKYSKSFKNILIQVEFIALEDNNTIFKILSKKSNTYLKVFINKPFIKFK